MSVTENPQTNIFIILWRKISYDPIHVCIVKKRYLANRVVLMAYRDYPIFCYRCLADETKVGSVKQEANMLPHLS